MYEVNLGPVLNPDGSPSDVTLAMFGIADRPEDGVWGTSPEGIAVFQPRNRDARGRYVPLVVAVTWSRVCDLCHEFRADHEAIRPSTGQPYCPDDFTSFEPCDVRRCLHPTGHEIGCDCGVG